MQLVCAVTLLFGTEKDVFHLAACCGHYSCHRKACGAPSRHTDDSHRNSHKPREHWRSHRHSHPGGESPPSRLKLHENTAPHHTFLADAMASEAEEKSLVIAIAEMPWRAKLLHQNAHAKARSAFAGAGLLFTTHIHWLPLMPLRSSGRSSCKVAFIDAYPAGEEIACTRDSNTLL